MQTVQTEYFADIDGDSGRLDQSHSNWLGHPGSGPQCPADGSCVSAPVRLEWVSPFLVPVFAV